MDKPALELFLRETLADFRLDNREKHQLREQLKDFTDAQRNYVRNRAFDLSRDAIAENAEASGATLAWLQKVVKACKLDSATHVDDQAFFSPGSSCRRAIIQQLNNARHTIEICVFTISDDVITEAIVAAHGRGVDVRIISDNHKSEDMGSDIVRMQEVGLALRLDDSPYHMHHKFALFDKRFLLNGSFNWTRSATDKNQENIVISGDEGLVRDFSVLFDQLWQSYA